MTLATTSPAPWRLERVEIDDTVLAYRSAGSGTPIVCLHAIGHDKDDFAALPARIKGPYRWIAVDWPGHGDSGRDRTPISADRCAALLAGFLEAAGIEEPILLGNSIGGAAAVRYAADHPGRVRGLVLANPGGLAPVDAMARRFCGLMARFFRAGARHARWFGPAFGLYYRTVLPAAPARARRTRIVASAYDVAPLLAEAWASFGRPEADLRSALMTLRCPVLFTWATGDRVVSLGRSLKAIESLPGAELRRFRGGHAAFLEDPDAFDAALREFLARLESETRGARRAAL